MKRTLNWYEVQRLVGGFTDKPSYLSFKADMTERYVVLAAELRLAKNYMKATQRAAALDNSKCNRIEMSNAQNDRRVLAMQAYTIIAALNTGKTRARKMASQS